MEKYEDDIFIREYNKSDSLLFFERFQNAGDWWDWSIKPTAKSLFQNYDGKTIKAFVACENEEIVGFIYGYVFPDGLLIPEFMYVDSNFRNRGIGRKLLSALEKESGCTSSMIFYNKALRDYYKKQGYSTGDDIETAIKMFED